MARIKKNADPWHVVTLRDDFDNGDLTLVNDGMAAYLWAGRDDSGCVMFSGRPALRKLAYAILKEVGRAKNRRKKELA